MLSRMAYDRVPLAGCGEHGNEHLVSKKARNFLASLFSFSRNPGVLFF